MFKGLRSWLFVSHVFIAAVCLVLLTVVLILAVGPIQARITAARLGAQLLPTAAHVRSLLRQGLTSEQVVATLRDQTEGQEADVLLLGYQGEVLADTQGTWTGQQFRGLIRPENRPAGQLYLVGTLLDPAGRRVTYVAIPVQMVRQGEGERLPLYVALVAPTAQGGGALLGDLGLGILLAAGVALALSLILALLIAAGIASPLQRIARAAEGVAAGDYDQELHITRPDEVRRLAESFNTMAHRVKASQQAQRDFVANVSHELKTPLTSIQGFSQALLEGATQDEETRHRAAAIIYDEAGRMARLVEELLDLARIESGQITMARQPLDLAEVVQKSVEALSLRAKTAGVQLVMDVPSLPLINGDQDRLAQVFANLLDNALKHTPAGGKVQVNARSLSGSSAVRRKLSGRQQPGTRDQPWPATWAEVSIADSGPGIPPEEISRIFERFYQIDKSRARKTGGAGLGLPIAREIVEAHGGTIKAESVLGLGTRFIVALPAAATH
jgi:two-component system OmpR family sensor kinase